MNTKGQLRVCFFAGPSLAAGDIHAACAGLAAEVCVLPPIQQGDLLRYRHDLPDVLAIIDGYFCQVPAVQHKEILKALDEGAYVLGAASLGALRAAELDAFGMEGIGEIYRLFKEGRLDGDDEVAVLHAGQEDGFRPLSEPLVNIRHNLQLARSRGLITGRTLVLLLASAKRLHFTERTYKTILKTAATRLASAFELTAFRGFLDKDAVELKRQDALTLVHTVKARVCGTEPWPRRTVFRFQRTKYFHILERDYVGHAVQGLHIPDTVVLSFHKLLSRSYPDFHRRVALRCLAADEALNRGLSVGDAACLLTRFRCSRDLRSDSEYVAWLCGNCLSEEELLASLQARDLEARLLALYPRDDLESREGVAQERLLAGVAVRFGVSEDELVGPSFMQPGILWEEPWIREIKLEGDFPRALAVASQILEFEAKIFQDKPELKLTFDSLLFQACDQVEGWVASQWGIPQDELVGALRKRGFLRYRDFLQVARLAYVYARHVPGPLFT